MAKEMAAIQNIQGLSLPEMKTDLFELLALLEQENLRLLKERQTGSCEFLLFNKKEELLSTITLEFPLTQDIEELLSSSYSSTNQLLSENELNQESTHLILDSRSFRRKATAGFRLKKPLVAVLVGILFSSGLVFFFHNPVLQVFQSIQSETIDEEATFSELVQDGNFLEAAEEHPNRIEEIVTYLSDQQDFSALQGLNEAFPTAEGTFELAFHQEDWQTVIQTELSYLDETRQIMLAHAYIESNHLTEAQIIASQVNQESLWEELDQVYFSEGIGALKSKNIQAATELMSSFHFEATTSTFQSYLDSATLMIQLIEHYEAIQDNDSRDQWERRLQELGGTNE